MDLLSRYFSFAQGSLEFAEWVTQAKPRPKATKQKIHLEHTEALSSTKPTETTTSIIHWHDQRKPLCIAYPVTNKNTLGSRDWSPRSPPPKLRALLLDIKVKLLLAFSPWNFLLGFLSIWRPASKGMMMDDVQGNVKGWWRQFPNSR